MLIHIVTEGETLYSVSRRYGVDPAVTAVNNGIFDPTELAVGQSLIIVFPSLTHTVKEGETLFAISRLYGVSLNQIYRNNLVLSGQPEVFPGQTLIIEINKDIIGSFMTGGYAYPFIDRQLLNTTLPAMSGLMPFTYGFTSDGTLIELDDGALIISAFNYGTKPIMHLSTLTEGGNFSSERATELLNAPEKWTPLISNIINEMEQKGYGGLDIDFEFLGAANAAAYAEFVSFVREVLNTNGFPVMVALAPKTSDTQPGTLYEGHDYALLGKAANSVLLMTYEWGYTYGPPMAVSPIQPVRRVIEYALTRIPSSKIFLGISNYGYDFTLPYTEGLSKATSISTVQATQLAGKYKAEIRYDDISNAPNFSYTESGVEHVVWYEDARSILSRLMLVNEYSLKGALYWNLMRQNPQNLTVIASSVELLPLNLF